jgi:hypothetical protein
MVYWQFFSKNAKLPSDRQAMERWWLRRDAFWLQA